MENKPQNARYNGYTSCPLFTGDKKLMLMEFGYNNLPMETFTTSQEKPTMFAYYLKKILFPETYWNFTPNGRWFGSRAIFQPKFK